MIFSSYPFLFAFLPAVLAGVVLLRIAARRGLSGGRALALWLTIGSLVFYGWWNPLHLPILIGSILVNHRLGRAMVAAGPGSRRSRALMWLGIGLDLGLLGWFKYRVFVAETAASLAGMPVDFPPPILPLAISFFTFQQVAWLVDVHRGRSPAGSLLDFGFFVSFFPQLIAGPIVHYGQLVPQLDRPGWLRWDAELFERGLTLFAIGFAKKVLIADGMAPAVSAVYAATAAGAVPTTAEAWGAAFGYGLQLYFDFSGYADMALGLAAMLGLRLPVNFWSPYRADSIIEFWRRWHMTLSQFLRDYVYIPLGGSRAGFAPQLRNLMLTMLLGGLWHGAAWAFVLWGGAHGLMLAVAHIWRRRVRLPVPRPLAWALTLVAVMAAWIPFRAVDLSVSLTLLAGLVPGEMPQPAGGPLEWGLAMLRGAPLGLWPWIVCGLMIALFLPNGLRLTGLGRLEQGMEAVHTPHQHAPALLSRPLRGALTAVLLLAGLKSLMSAPPSEFLYFNF